MTLHATATTSERKNPLLAVRDDIIALWTESLGPPSEEVALGKLFYLMAEYLSERAKSNPCVVSEMARTIAELAESHRRPMYPTANMLIGTMAEVAASREIDAASELTDLLRLATRRALSGKFLQ